MQKKKWILEIIGSMLERHGFAFSKNKYWEFEREINGILQTIAIEDEDFRHLETEARALHLKFSTTAYGSRIPVEITKLIPKEELPKARYMAENINKRLSIKFPGSLEYWTYDDEESFKAVLGNFVHLIETYGFDKLEELSIEEEVIPTNEMGTRLVSSYEMLSEKFIKENHLDITSTSREDIEGWFDLIKQKFEETKEESYQDVQDMLVEITAFLGEQLRKEVGGKWCAGHYEARGVSMSEMNVWSTRSWKPLPHVIGSWKHQDINWLRERYFLFLDSKLPLTHEQMLELHKRTCEMDKLKYPNLISK